MQLAQKRKIASVRVGFLTCLALMTSLCAAGIDAAHPAKYRDTRVNPILLMAATDDFRAPPAKPGMQTANSSFAMADDFRAPPSDLIQTGSTHKTTYCSRATYKNCDPHH